MVKLPFSPNSTVNLCSVCMVKCCTFNYFVYSEPCNKMCIQERPFLCVTASVYILCSPIECKSALLNFRHAPQSSTFVSCILVCLERAFVDVQIICVHAFDFLTLTNKFSTFSIIVIMQSILYWVLNFAHITQMHAEVLPNNRIFNIVYTWLLLWFPSKCVFQAHNLYKFV